MGLFKNEKSSWLGIVLNPVGYLADHVPIGESADKYYRAVPPSFDASSASEVSFKTYRQQWIDSCASDVKSGDVGYSKANAAQACASKFDNDPITQQVQDALNQRAENEKTQVQASTAQNTKIILALIGAFLLIALLLYLFLS